MSEDIYKDSIDLFFYLRGKNNGFLEVPLVDPLVESAKAVKLRTGEVPEEVQHQLHEVDTDTCGNMKIWVSRRSLH